MTIRKARINDLGQIEKLHDLYVLDLNKVDNPDYRNRVEKNGFTVSTGDTNLAKRIKTSQVFKVYELDNKIVGYVDIDKEIYFPENAENIKWKDNKKTELLHRFAGLTKEKEIFYVQVKENRSTGRKYFMSCFPPE